MKRSMIAVAGAAAVLMAASATMATAPYSYSTNFDSMTIGKITGQDGWVDSEATYTEGITTDAAHSGTHSWWLGMNTGNTMVESIKSPQVAYAGESTDYWGTATSSRQISYEFWFSTKAAHADHENLYINSSLAKDASIRQTWLGIMDGDKWGPSSQNNTSGQIGMGPFADDELRIVAYGQGTVPGGASGAYSPALTWGAWYKVKVDAIFNDGQINDVVTYTVLDASLTQVWSASMTSWERAYYNGTYEPNQQGAVVGVNQVSFDWSTTTTPAGIYIDDFKVVVPEPATMSLLALGGIATLIRRKRRA